MVSGGVMAKVKISLHQAYGLAERIKAELAPVCDKIQIAGSIRRKKQQIGDIEIVCIPKQIQLTDLFGDVTSVQMDGFENKLSDLVKEGRLLPPTKNGDKFKQFGIPAVKGLMLDLFIATPDNWGIILAIRTGSTDFSRRLVTQRNKGGLLPDEYRVSDGKLWRGTKAIPTPTEEGVFDLIGGWIDPTDRKR